jgi:putative SOS response-associated peptidase YedK
MCGRFLMTQPNDAVARIFDARPDNDLPQVPRYNICPTQEVAVVTAVAGRRLQAMRWGFIPSWYATPAQGPLIINARAETIATKPAFRDAVRARRCIIPAAGFYEWSAGQGGARLPWLITRSDGALMGFAGIWQAWQGQQTCAMVTVDAGPGLVAIHHREPVILEPADWPLWLGEAGHGAALLMVARGPGVLQSHRVSPAVNSNRAEGPALIEPFDD